MGQPPGPCFLDGEGTRYERLDDLESHVPHVLCGRRGWRVEPYESKGGESHARAVEATMLAELPDGDLMGRKPFRRHLEVNALGAVRADTAAVDARVRVIGKAEERHLPFGTPPVVELVAGKVREDRGVLVVVPRLMIERLVAPDRETDALGAQQAIGFPKELSPSKTHRLMNGTP